MKKYFLLFTATIVFLFSGYFFVRYYFIQKSSSNFNSEELSKSQAEANLRQDRAVQKIIESRRLAQTETDTDLTKNIFEKSDIVHILLLGLDKRIGQTQGHCDVIQMIAIDSKKQEVRITAVPRGTYSPLPPGKAVTSTDYYVSNACGLAGLDYGIAQIEKILGQKADYLVVVGFSETLGIIRSLNLPTTETLQWLRRRQVYAIGEPQRARNHSTFLKTLLTQYLPKEKSALDTPIRYMAYKTVQTDLSFAQVQTLVNTLIDMDLSHHSERVQLSMRPAHNVQDIPYDPAHLDIKPGKDTEEGIQKQLLDTIEAKKNNAEFVVWAYDNDLWLQVNDAQKRESIRFDFLERYVSNTPEKEKREAILADYILEMEQRAEDEWITKGKELLLRELKRL